MLPEISDEDIGYAEQILFGRRGLFDDERIAFIKNLTTLDLQAVPGSGKTTALLAKLLILEKCLPLQAGSGILVISHTNAAVNEIKNKIGDHCPRLFAYPNFVGTIQSFVDRFLAIPFAHNYLGADVVWIDSELYQDTLWRKYKSREWDADFEDTRKFMWARHIGDCLKDADNDKAKAGKLCGERIEKDIRNLFFDFGDQKIKVLGAKKPLLPEPANPKYLVLKTLMDEVVEKGVISYEYAYSLAGAYIQKAPIIRRLIQKRFGLVFVDEMQDMEKHQYDLLESLFGDGSGVIYQRIGDKNQAIYSGRISLDKIWVDRKNLLFLRGSHRLSPKTAQIVNKFALDPSFSIEGRGDSTICPCMIVFSDGKAQEVLSRFLKLVKEKIPEEVISRSKHPIKCIGWRKQGEDGGLGISTYYADYEFNATNAKMLYPSLHSQISSWAVSSNQKHPMNASRKSILESFISILKLEDVLATSGRYYTVSSLYKYLREFNKEFYEGFKFSLFIWSKGLCQDRPDEVITSVRSFLPDFLKVFQKKVNKSSAFVNGVETGPILQSGPKRKSVCSEGNVHHCTDTDLRARVGTVHSAKGETHLATLYVETFYQTKHESDRLPACFCNGGNGFANTYEKETARIAYVAMSRPTHLLCFAIHETRYKAIAEKIDGWEIVDLT